MKPSRQLAWQRRMLDMGFCRSCGRNRLWYTDRKTYTRCFSCLVLRRKLYKAKKPC